MHFLWELLLVFTLCSFLSSLSANQSPYGSLRTSYDQTNSEEAVLTCDTDGVSTYDTCQNYWWGGTSGVHFYTCCNNCEDGNNNTACAWKTWQGGGSRQLYCGQCGSNVPYGTPASPGCQLNIPYTCGGCDGETKSDSTCLHWYVDFPGVCWIYTACFSLQCRDYQQETLSAFSESYNNSLCGNMHCDADLGETTETCPLDCCQTVTQQCNFTEIFANYSAHNTSYYYDDILSANISLYNESTNTTNSSCNAIPLCCAESTCCLPVYDADDAAAHQYSLKQIQRFLIPLMAIVGAYLLY